MQGLWGTGMETGFIFDPYFSLNMGGNYVKGNGFSSTGTVGDYVNGYAGSGFGFKGGFVLSETNYKFNSGFNSSVSMKNTLNLLRVETSQSINLETREKTYELMIGKGKDIGASSNISVTGTYQIRGSFKH